MGPEPVATAVGEWSAAVGAGTAFVGPQPDSPRENGGVESVEAKLRGELPCGEVFRTLREARVPSEARRRHRNAPRPHTALGRRPPAPELCIAGAAAWPPSSPVDRMAPVLATHRHVSI